MAEGSGSDEKPRSSSLNLSVTADRGLLMGDIIAGAGCLGRGQRCPARRPARRPQGSGVAPVGPTGAGQGVLAGQLSPSPRGGRSRACRRGLTPFRRAGSAPGAATRRPAGVPAAPRRAAGGVGGGWVGERVGAAGSGQRGGGSALRRGKFGRGKLPPRPPRREEGARGGRARASGLPLRWEARAPPPRAPRRLPGHSRRPGGLPPGRASLPSAAIRPPLTRHPALLPRGAARGSPSPAASGRCVGREPRRGRAGESGARRPPRRSRRESGRERGSRGGVCARVCERESEGERGTSGGDSENAAPAGQERLAAPSRRRSPGRDPEAGETRPPPPNRAPPPPPGAGLSVPPSAASQEPPGGGAPPASNRRCARRERPPEGCRRPPGLVAFPGDPESEI
ncbi:collagen alpha-1(I) chain-like [Odocoileus virginianus]|uniref:Collagen alpha-1(I) chain-like n=1 Tax=Odocoileus virginianus TaxID=9874 RepID=A0ABM4IJD3_ODOVR